MSIENRQTAVDYFYNELIKNAKLSNSFSDLTWLINKQRVIEIFNHCKILEKIQEHELISKGFNLGFIELEAQKDINGNYKIKSTYGKD